MNLRRCFLGLAVFSLFAIAGGLLIYRLNGSVARGDEAIHTRVVQEMAFEKGTLISPTFFGNLYLNKPPLQFWLSTPLVSSLGDRNFVYRIVPVAAGFAPVDSWRADLAAELAADGRG